MLEEHLWVAASEETWNKFHAPNFFLRGFFAQTNAIFIYPYVIMLTKNSFSEKTFLDFPINLVEFVIQYKSIAAIKLH